MKSASSCARSLARQNRRPLRIKTHRVLTSCSLVFVIGHIGNKIFRRDLLLHRQPRPGFPFSPTSCGRFNPAHAEESPAPCHRSPASRRMSAGSPSRLLKLSRRCRKSGPWIVRSPGRRRSKKAPADIGTEGRDRKLIRQLQMRWRTRHRQSHIHAPGLGLQIDIEDRIDS